MNLPSPPPQTSQIVEVNWADRWEVYRRLQELQIPCQCYPDKPLQVQTLTPKDAIQLWSVMRQVTAPRYQLIGWLKDCWALEISNDG